MENYGSLFTPLPWILIGLVGGQMIALIIWLLAGLTRRGRRNNHEVMAENFRLQAAQIRVQTAEEDERAMRTAIESEEVRYRLIQTQSENDQAEIQRRENLRQAGIDPCTPPPCGPKNWFGKHRFWIMFALFWIFITIISILYDKGVIR